MSVLTDIRAATVRDRPRFMGMWMEYLKEQRDHGSVTLPSQESLQEFRGYFDDYVLGNRTGWAGMGFIDEELVAIVLAGEYGIPRDHDLGRVLSVWGVYTVPEHRGKGISLELLMHGIDGARNWDTHTVEFSIRPDNKASIALMEKFGAVPYQTFYYLPIAEKTKD